MTVALALISPWCLVEACPNSGSVGVGMWERLVIFIVQHFEFQYFWCCYFSRNKNYFLGMKIFMYIFGVTIILNNCLGVVIIVIYYYSLFKVKVQNRNTFLRVSLKSKVLMGVCLICLMFLG